jgi:hypothetical protein
MKPREGRWTAEVQNDDARGLFGRKAPNVSEIAIHSHQDTGFVGTSPIDALINRSRQPLLTNSHNVMATLLQDGHAAAADILVGFDFHAAGSTGTGMMRSRAASAP